MPGKWAAPPAPAMMAFKPRPRACSAYSNIRSGVRWADTTLHSNATPNCCKKAAACCMTFQSLLLPIMMPTCTIVKIPVISIVVLRVWRQRCEDREHAHASMFRVQCLFAAYRIGIVPRCIRLRRPECAVGNAVETGDQP